ncbi:hypothetical protein A3758_07510 [Oleiphilus sp. HI0118]|nr:hypothetical protein A3758_07510 [Oleiphilus sp. HI0118]
MPLYRLLYAVLVSTLSLFWSAAHAIEHFDAFEDWHTKKSEYASVTYPEGYEVLANRSLEIVDAVIPQLSQFLDWKPESTVQIVLSNETDRANGYATPAPYNRSVLYATLPSGVSELQDYGEWFDFLILHEMTHIVHLDKARDWSYAPRYVFGRNLFTFSNLFQPNFFKEGLATYVETSWDHHTGRGQSAFFNMMLRSEVASGLLPLGKVQQTTRDWPLNKAYTYGFPFYQFLDERYGIDALTGYIDTTSGQLVPFVVDRPARHNTDATGLEDLWLEYMQWVEERYQGQLAALEGTTTPFSKISETGYFNISPKVDAAGNIYYAAFDPYGPSYITQVDGAGTKRPLVRVKSNANIIAVDEEHLWYIQQSPCTHVTYSSDLYRYNLKTGQSEKVTKCGHYTDGVILNDRFLGVKVLHAQRSIVEVDLNSKVETTIFEAANFDNIGSLIAINDDTLAFTYKAGASKWSVRSLDLNTEKSDTILSSPIDNYFAIESGRPSDNSTEHFIVTSDKDGLIELWELDLTSKRLQPLTRSIGGASDGQYDAANDRLVFRSYSENGWDIAEAPYKVQRYNSENSETSLRLAKPGTGFELEASPVPKEAANAQPETQSYSALETVAPTSWFFGYQNDNAQNTLSLVLSGRDALNFHNWGLVVGRDFENDVNKLQASYTLYNHFTALYSKDYDYALGGASAPPEFVDKTTLLEENENIALLAHTDIPFDFSNLRIVGGGNQEQREADYLLNPALNNALTVNTVGLAVQYTDASYALYGISPSHGRILSMNLERDKLERDFQGANTDSSDGNVWTVEWNEYLSLYNAHTLALRVIQGYAEQGADVFDLGDSPSSSPFEQAIIHGRDYPLRGYPDRTSELVGYKPEIYSAEYRFPIAYVDQGLSSWPIGLNTVSGAVFYEAGSPNRGSRMFDAAGFELNIGVDLGYSTLPVATRFGVAVPFDRTNAAPDKDTNIYFGFGYRL